ncbi:PepSY domain-containing protein, partial [Kaarinaea lacus]
MAFATKWNSRRIHKWCGLTAAVWLAVLGISGLLLDHRHEWRWLWQSTVPESVVPQSVIDKAESGVNRLFQVHPRQQGVVIAGGPQGLWRSDDNGKHWRSTHFLNTQSMPTVYAAVLDKNFNRTWLWLATDDGIWLSRNFGDSAQQIELRNQHVTALTPGYSKDMLLGVEDRSRAFEFNTASYHINWLNLEPLDSNTLPVQISLSRFIHDIHFGRGLVHANMDLWISDLAGVALLLLPLTGLLFWYLPKRWKKQKDSKTPAPIKKYTMRWLVRLHGPTVGLLFALPIFYLAISGIFLDHAKELRVWMKTIPITRMLQTPVYSMRSWSGEIYAIAAYPDNPNRLSVGTRTGLYTSNDRGRTWFREQTINGFVWTLKRINNTLFL